MRHLKYILIITLAFTAVGCATNNDKILETDQSQVELRAFQTKKFPIADEAVVLRAIVNTFQDTGFVIQKIESDIGTVTASKFGVVVTATTKKVDDDNTSVRLTGTFNKKPIADPEHFQKFFTGLSKSLFLDENMPG